MVVTKQDESDQPSQMHVPRINFSLFPCPPNPNKDSLNIQTSKVEKANVKKNRNTIPGIDIKEKKKRKRRRSCEKSKR